MVGRFRVLAHRGAMATSPENTLASIETAKNEGADGIELDVQLSADGQPFLFHDRTGERVAGVRGPLGWRPWKEIKLLRAFGRHPIPHLEEALAAAEGWSGAEVYLDLHQRSDELARAVGRALGASAIRGRAFALDFYSNRQQLLLAARAAPGVRFGVMPGAPWNTGASVALGAAGICLGWDRPATKALYMLACRLWDIRPMAERARRQGLSVSAGVANTPQEIMYFVSQGFDAIWTDDLKTAFDTLAAAS
ncbi:MAG: glycerophosphodiester phosphodiesterase [Elusimicrobia bacterium]|nr:glycerophosphodiester phosphodiesterase [Elusimicrobiota bacterium]